MMTNFIGFFLTHNFDMDLPKSFLNESVIYHPKINSLLCHSAPNAAKIVFEVTPSWLLPS